MAAIDELVKANREYAASFSKGRPKMPPARKTAIVTCMDARIDPARALGLEEGDAQVIRNAGGRVVEAVNSIRWAHASSSVDWLASMASRASGRPRASLVDQALAGRATIYNQLTIPARA